MEKSLPIYNWSLKKLLLTETNTFNKARIKILYTILLFSLLKVLVVLVITYYHQQYFQLQRGIVALIIYSVLLKVILADKSYFKLIIHVMIWVGIILVWTNIFIAVQGINTITLQFVFMTIVSSFYFLNNKYLAIFYSIINALPIIIFMILFNNGSLLLNVVTDEISAPGNVIIVTLNFITLIIAHYLYIQAFSSNIDEKESLNSQLKQALEIANKHAQSKSDFLSTMSHELRTPLNSVIGITDLLLDNPINEEQKESLNILHFSAVSLNSLINDILDFNKLDSGMLQLEMISVDLDKLINNICSGLGMQAKEKGLNLILHIDDAIRKKNVITDPTRITQIIYNLVGNGIKFTNEGNVSLSLKLLSSTSDTINVRFSVLDTGIGISDDKQTAIFEPFVQGSANTTRNFGGTGLGLSIVKRLLILFGSEIHLESSLESGSNFFFDIAFKLDNNAVVAKGATNIETPSDLRGLRVLIAEDNQMNILLIKKLCAKWNIEPVIAENGMEVVEKLQQAEFDVILMDIHMPILDGYDATKSIRNLKDASKSKTPIIAISASVSEDLSVKIKEAGMTDYLRKPIDAKELYAKLKNIQYE